MKKAFAIILKIVAALAIIGILTALYRQQIYEAKFRDGLILTVFRDELQQAADSYYDNQPGVTVASYSAEILSLSHASDGYYIKFRVFPYIGAHNTIGIDEVTYFVSNSGNTTIKEYLHMKDYD